MNRIRFCGRDFSGDDLRLIQTIIGADDRPNRAEISRRVCRALAWVRSEGRLKDMSCRVALLRMHRSGLITLPSPEKGNGNGQRGKKITGRSDPEFPITKNAGRLEKLHLKVLGFGAAAWKTAPRDRWIGWSHKQRTEKSHLIVNNARFLILPWVTSRNLASKILAMATARLPDDWQKTYGYRPLLMETFVEKERFKGTCYKAANWIYLGDTTGRGKLDCRHQHSLPVKAIFIYPLDPTCRKVLTQ